MEEFDVTTPVGGIIATVEYKNGSKLIHQFPNTVLLKGRIALANYLAKQDAQKDIYIQNMLFGDGGFNDEQGGKHVVNAERTSLFGITRVNKPVIGQIDPVTPTMAIFTAVITFEEGNDYTLNEMALQFNNGELFSMATFPSLNKTEQVQIFFNWRLAFC